jgi:hypothetical protein
VIPPRGKIIMGIKLVQVFDDIAFSLPLFDIEVYYSSDGVYKVLVSNPFKPFKLAGKDAQLITIAESGLMRDPDDRVCELILAELDASGAIDINKEIGFPRAAKNTRRFLRC